MKRSTDSNLAKKIATLSVLIIMLTPSIMGILPFPARADPGATVALDVSSGTPGVADADINSDSSYGGWILTPTLVTVTGTGFPSNQSGISLRIASASAAIGTGAGDDLSTFNPYPYTGGTSFGNATRRAAPTWNVRGTTIQADANGYFKVRFYAPPKEAGTYNVFAVYTPSGGAATTSAGASFTVNSAAAIVGEDGGSSGIYGQRIHFMAAGFKGSEEVQFTPANFWVTTQGSTTATNTTGSFFASSKGDTASRSSSVTAFVGDRQCPAGGFPSCTVTVTFTGQTSGITATASLTLKASIHWNGNAGGGTVLSFDSQSTTKTIQWWGHNFPASGFVAPNSLTVTVGSTTVTVSHTSIRSDSKGRIVAAKGTLSNTIPTGPATLSFNGTEFSLAKANIVPQTDGATAALGGALQASAGDDMQNFGIPWTGAVVASNDGQALKLDLDKTTFSPQPGVRAIEVRYVYISGAAASTSISLTTTRTGTSDSAPVTLSQVLSTGTTDSNGAFVTYVKDWANSKKGSQLVKASVGSESTESQITIVPRLRISSTTWEYAKAITFNGFGFIDGESITVTAAGTTLFTISSSSVNSTGNFDKTSFALPDLPFGSVTANATGTSAGNFATKTASNKVQINANSLTARTGTAGGTVTVQTTSTEGLRGLKASKAYDLYFGPVGAGGVKVASFTSRSDGTMPVGGVSFTVPSGLAAGVWMIDAAESGATTSAIYGNLASSSAGAFSNNKSEDGGVYLGGLIFRLTTTVTVTPSAGNVGTTLTVSAKGLVAAATYVIVSNLTGSPKVGEFTAASDGTASTSFKFPEAATVSEVGTTITLTVKHSVTGDVAGTGRFTLQAAASVSPSSGASGSTTTLTATGLKSEEVYIVRFGWKNKDNPGTPIVTFSATKLGSSPPGGVTFTVPTVDAGNYNVAVFRSTDSDFSTPRVAIPPVFSVTGAAVGQVDQTTLSNTAKSVDPATGAAKTSFKQGESVKVTFQLATTSGTADVVWRITLQQPDLGVFSIVTTSASISTTPKTFDFTQLLPGTAQTGTWTATVQVFSSDGKTPLAVVTVTFTVTKA